MRRAAPSDCIVLVAGGADGVEGPIRLLQLASGDIERARGDLVLEQLNRLAGGEAAPLMQGGIGGQALGRVRGSGEVVVERALDDGDTVEGHAQWGMTSMWRAPMIRGSIGLVSGW